MKRVVIGIVVVSLALPARAHAETLLEGLIDLLVDGGNNYNWEKVALPGTQCGNGSQYKFFARRTSSPNLLFFFEGGGACWDFDTCQRMEKIHHWWEYLTVPPGQTFKCYSELVPMDVFLRRFIADGTRTRIREPANAYNAQDPGMKIIASLFAAATGS